MSQPIRVLLIDDEPDFLETISYWLTSQGYQVALATTGVEALTHVTRQAPDIIFLDLVMPRMDGLETLKRLRASKVTTPVVLLTATEQSPSELIEFQALGIAGVFQKQASLEAFRHVLESALTSRPPAS